MQLLRLQLPHLKLPYMQQTCHSLTCRRATSRATHLIVGVANDGGAPGAHVVHVLVAIHVPRMRPLDAVKDNGLAPHRLEGAHGRVHTAGHQLLHTSRWHTRRDT